MKQNKKLLLLAFAGLLITFFLIKTALGNGDFKCFLEAAKLLTAGENPYNKWIFVSENNYALYFYSPLWLLILIPFTYLPYFIPNFLFLCLNVWFLYRTWQLLNKYVDITILTKKQFSWLVILTLILSIRFILYNFGMIQMTIFLLWALLESIQLFKDNKFIRGGILLAFVINIKLLPVVVMPYLLYRKQYKGFAVTLIFTLIFLVLPSIFLGWSKNNFLLSEWWTAINPSNSKHLIESDMGPHSLTALIPSLLTETEGKLPYARNFLNLDPATAIFITNLIRAALVLLTLVFLKLPSIFGSLSKLFELRELAYIVAIIPLIFPHQQKYAFLLILPAVFYLSHFVVFNFPYREKVMTKRNWTFLIALLIVSFALMTLTTDGLIGRNLNNITQHYKTITWGTFALIGALFIANPKITLQTMQLQKVNNNLDA